MHDELTREDIRKMQEELDYRRLELHPGILEEVKRTRAFGSARTSAACAISRA